MTENLKPKRPTHTIYKVTGEGEATLFVKVGVAFPHKDGRGMQLVVDGFPVEGRIALRLNRERKATEPTQQNLPNVAAQAA